MRSLPREYRHEPKLALRTPLGFPKAADDARLAERPVGVHPVLRDDEQREALRARARTFGFEHEVAALRAAGLLKGGSLDNAVVLGDTKEGSMAIRVNEQMRLTHGRGKAGKPDMLMPMYEGPCQPARPGGLTPKEQADLEAKKKVTCGRLSEFIKELE